MDYANSSAGKATLALARYPYSVEPRLGTLFINPGTHPFCAWFSFGDGHVKRPARLALAVLAFLYVLI